MNYFMIRFTFHLQNQDSMDIARKEFGGLLRKLNLKYRSVNDFDGYQCSSRSDSRPWELDFLILPPEYQQDTCWEALRLLSESYLKPFQAAHPELGDVTIYRNLHNFPFLTQLTSDWWK